MVNASEVVKVIQDDLGYELDITIKNADGTDKNLTTFTAFDLRVWDIDDPSVALITKVMTNPSGSITRYVTEAGWVDALVTDGSKKYEYTVLQTKPGVEERTLPARFKVIEGGPT